MTTPSQSELAALTDAGWSLRADHSAITKTFVFQNFTQAFAWMTRCAFAAEKLNHHPEWSNVYKTVQVTLTTHDTGGLTELDYELAQLMDSFA